MPVITTPQDRARRGGLCSDLAAALRQQMVFWGRDVVHERGNLLLAQGFTKSPSAGLQNSSCYGLDWRGGRIELHGACAGWFPQAGGDGFLFIRPSGRCFLWRGAESPVPGEWPVKMLAAGEHTLLLEKAQPFLDWWTQSERWVDDLLGPSYRSACHRHLKRLPKGKPWLAPADAMRWVAMLAVDPESAPRAKRFTSATPSFPPAVHPRGGRT